MAAASTLTKLSSALASGSPSSAGRFCVRRSLHRCLAASSALDTQTKKLSSMMDSTTPRSATTKRPSTATLR